MRKSVFYCFFVLCLVSNALAAPKQLRVMVSIAPQSYLVEKIAKERAKVSILVPQNLAPESYEPRPEQMKEIKDMRLFVGIGMPYEKKWQNRFKQVNPRMRVINSTSSIPQNMFIENDNHTWLSPKLLKLQAKEIFYAIASIDLHNKKIYEENYEALLKELDSLDSEIKAIFAKEDSKKIFVVAHSCLKYFARDYGLQELALDFKSAEKAKQLSEVKAQIKDSQIHTIFTQPQYSKKQAQALSYELKAQIEELNVLSADIKEMLLKVAHAIAEQGN
ncbi:hypothetical protein CQA49_06015 [Helicobacter sp. MIT 00-7814]|uniref:metal ABC transporter solute-binding protein, Zn/Mn family n=1 Tax=unclassified Helicobacter TaxID=2593540 RepID=UPI000E1F14D2|nr:MULTISPECIES: zinc ABC transporter substrate-binding protein [unclassified Helicobacter]RDU53439.1 hypothetical protein CQA37_06925 [Helicobacter sp. MIT 99-10781]RDU53737.1 hypothetical protein CQA49_06015 [Helicobacter sp. MIT 00-7814]